MMAYQQGHVVSVIVNGQVKREQAEGSERTIRIPFDSEYALRIHNKTNYRSLVKVLIDGTVCAEKLLLRPNQSIDLERFVIDGDLLKGKKFKFVSLKNQNVQDPTAGENGLIEVVIDPEVQYTYAYNPPINWTIWNYFNHQNPGNLSVSPNSGSGMIYGANSVGGMVNSTAGGEVRERSMSPPAAHNFMNVQTNGMDMMSTSVGSTYTSNQTIQPHEVTQQADQGATVEGSVSHQKFVETSEWFSTGTAIKIPIRLRGPKVQNFTWDLQMGTRTLQQSPHAKIESFEVTSTHLVVRIPIDQVKLNV